MLRQPPQVLLELPPPLLGELVLLHHLAVDDALVWPLRDEVPPVRLREPGGESDDVAEPPSDAELRRAAMAGGADPGGDGVGDVGGAARDKGVRGLLHRFRIRHDDSEIIRGGGAGGIGPAAGGADGVLGLKGAF